MTDGNSQHPIAESIETPQPDPLALALTRTEERAAAGIPPDDGDHALLSHQRTRIDAALAGAAPTPKLITDWSKVKFTGRQWIIPDWLPAGRIGLLTGKGEKGKSLLAIQLAVAISTGGGKWEDRGNGVAIEWTGPGTQIPFPKVKAGKAIIANWEDEAEEVRRRLNWIEKQECKAGKTTPLTKRLSDRFAYIDMARFGPVWGRQGPSPRAAPDLTTIGRWLRRQVEQLREQDEPDKPPYLLIFDPLINAFGADENANEDAAQFMADWGGWARDNNCAVLILHHPSKGDKSNDDHGYRGASAWSAEARFHWQLTDEKSDDDQRIDVLIARKASYAPRPNPINLRKDKTTHWVWTATDTAKGADERPERKENRYDNSV